MYYKDVEDEDHDRMTLESLTYTGIRACQKICISGSIQVAMIDGKWYAIHHRSQNPSYLRNREQRSNWAQVVGIPVKDVERYVRRIRDKCQRKRVADDINDAKELLERQGYTIVRI